MTFQSTSRNIRLQNKRVPTLLAECRDYEGKWKPSALDLDLHIGNSDGKFVLGGRNFSQSIAFMELRGPMLQASLVENNRQYSKNSILDLNLCVANINGKLTFQKPSDSALSSGCCYSLDGSFLKGLCMGYDGLFYHSTVDLNRWFGNNNGQLGTGPGYFNFSRSSRNSSITASQKSLLLEAELQDDRGNWRKTSIDLSASIIIENGALSYKYNGPFDRDGSLTRFFERVPFVGFVVAGLHAWAGNNDRARRAMAFCANSSIVCAGIVIGSYFGGPMGGALGAGLTTWIGVLVETSIADKIKDPVIKGQFEEATVGRIIYETIRNMLAAAAAEYFAHHLGELVAKGLITVGVLREIASKFGKVVQIPSDFAAYSFLKRLIDAFKNGSLPIEWTQAETKVKQLSPDTMEPKEYY